MYRILTALAFTLLIACTQTVPSSQDLPLRPQVQLGNIRNADPSVIRDGSTYYSVESDGNNLYVRAASSTSALNNAARVKIWGSKPNVWAPEIVKIGSTFYVYFAAGNGNDQRMYYVSSNNASSGYQTNAVFMNLPDNKWAIDGVPFKFNNQWWFVWSGWAGDTNVEQNLYIARMSNPTTVTGARYIISQPRESWERSVGNPFINEGPQPIKDPSGQLHIVYSANGSWSTDYCLGDLRLRSGGDPTYVWDWYKSNGCLFGAKQNLMMSGWNATLYAKGVGHHSFVLLNGDIDTSPPAGPTFPSAYHGVPNSMDMSWSNRFWYAGTFAWWGNTTYCRFGNQCNTGWSLKFFE
jgi:GH43 family beta-xylosidase